MILTSVAVISRVLSNPLGNVFQKQLTNRYNHPLLINFLTFLLLSVFCIIPAIQVRWLELPFEILYSSRNRGSYREWILSKSFTMRGSIGTGPHQFLQIRSRYYCRYLLIRGDSKPMGYRRNVTDRIWELLCFGYDG